MDFWCRGQWYLFVSMKFSRNMPPSDEMKNAYKSLTTQLKIMLFFFPFFSGKLGHGDTNKSFFPKVSDC